MNFKIDPFANDPATLKMREDINAITQDAIRRCANGEMVRLVIDGKTVGIIDPAGRIGNALI